MAPCLAAPPASAPSILRTVVKGPVVSVQVPRGIQQVVLEQRQGGGWKPASVAYPRFGLQDATKNIAFALPQGLAAQDVRARGFRALKFPARLTNSKRDFERTEPQAPAGGWPQTETTGLAEGAALAAEAGAEVWEFSGAQLAYFHQRRGLQILDLADPENPVRTGSLRLSAGGGRLHALDTAGSRLALVAASQDQERAGLATIFSVTVTDGTPVLAGEVPLEGRLLGSKAAGHLLHVLCRQRQGGDDITVLTSVDMADPAMPQVLGKLTLEGSRPTLEVAGDLLLLGMAGRDGALAHVVKAGAAPSLLKTVRPKGARAEAARMGLCNGALVVVSRHTEGRERHAWVETFPLEEGAGPAAAATLELPESPRLSLLDGAHLYLFCQAREGGFIVVDVQEPLQPVIRDRVDVPGRPMLLEPCGSGRLVAASLVKGRAVVSLLDVENAVPALLASWTENTGAQAGIGADDVAEYVPENNVLLVRTLKGGAGAPGVRCLQVERDALLPQAWLPCTASPRGGAIVTGHLAAISERELWVHPLSAEVVDASPMRLPLAWRTDRVAPFGDYLVQVEDGSEEPGSRAMIRVSPTSEPDMLIEEMDLGPGHVVGHTLRDDRLWLARWQPAEGPNPARLVTHVLAMHTPPLLVQDELLVHELEGSIASDVAPERAQGLWADAHTLVWFLPARGAKSPSWWEKLTRFHDPGLRLPSVLPGPLRNGDTSPNTAAVLCKIRTLAGGAAAVAPRIISTDGALQETSAAQMAGGLLFFSHDTQRPESRVPARPGPVKRRSWLHVMDLHGPEMVVRDAVSIPGPLLGVTQADAQGAILFTHTRLRLRPDAPAARVMQACAYDGASAWQLDNYITATPYHGASVCDGTRLYLTREMGGPAIVTMGYTASTGRLAQLASWPMSSPAALLDFQKGHLLASTYGNFEVAAVEPGGKLKPVASFDTPEALWLRVDRAAFTAAQDVWIPAGGFGVEFFQHQVLEP